MTAKENDTRHGGHPSNVRRDEADIGDQVGDSDATWRILKNLPDVLPACLSFLGTDRKYRYVNKLYEVWFGHKHDEIMGKHPWDLMGQDAY
jgi:hypothetical protein